MLPEGLLSVKWNVEGEQIVILASYKGNNFFYHIK